jgi:hypothetical protein
MRDDCSVTEKWRKLALFFECPKRHFSALQTPRQIENLQSAMRYVRGVWLAGGAEPGAIFHWGDTSELRVARSAPSALARGETDISLQLDQAVSPRNGRSGLVRFWGLRGSRTSNDCGVIPMGFRPLSLEFCDLFTPQGVTMSEPRNRMIGDMQLAGLVDGTRREYLRAVRQ